MACNARDGERGRLSECAPRRPRPRGPLLVGEPAAGVLGVEGWIAFAYDAASHADDAMIDNLPILLRVSLGRQRMSLIRPAPATHLMIDAP